MFSLLQQTAPAAVPENNTTVVTDPVTPADVAPATAPAAATPAVEPVVTPDASTHGTDAIVVPAANDAAATGTLAPEAVGHAPAGVETVASGAPVADAAQSAGMPQLDFATFGNQIFWLLVALVVIYLILSRVALPRISRILADRQGLMTADLSAAEDFRRKARDAEAAYERALADARAEAQKIVAANKAEIQGELNAAIARADAEISARAAESERRITEIRASAAQDARTVAEDVAAELVRRFGANADASALSSAVEARMKGAVQ